MASKRSDRPRRPRHLHAVADPAPGPEEQALLQQLRRGLRSTDPMELLALVSTLLDVTDPRGDDLSDPDPDAPRRGDLIESLIDTPCAETSAALTVIAELVADAEVAEHIRATLAGRRHPLPPWLAALSEARLEPDVWSMTHVLGEGEDYFLGVTLPTGDSLAALISIDHTLGGVVKDGWVASITLTTLVERARSAISDAGGTVTVTDAAAARATIEAAIGLGARMHPLITSDEWPQARPLIEWLVRKLPGGLANSWVRYLPEDLPQIAEEFFGSPFAQGLGSIVDRRLLEGVLAFGISHGPGDPLRWSPAAVEVLLLDWFPEKTAGPVGRRSRLPHVLRAFVRYGHDRVGIPAVLTEQTLATVSACEADYLTMIRSPRRRESLGLIDGVLEGLDPFEPLTVPDLMVQSLDRAVGGREALIDLDTQPLPDEEFDWTDVAEDVRPVVGQILDRCDRCADEILDVEHRTAMRRFLARAAVVDPAIFRRTASPERGAAAVAWAICRANETVGSATSDLLVRELLAWFGVKGTVSQRAEALLRANGVELYQEYGRMDLATPELLTSRRRRRIAELRDRWLSQTSQPSAGRVPPHR